MLDELKFVLWFHQTILAQFLAFLLVQRGNLDCRFDIDLKIQVHFFEESFCAQYLNFLSFFVISVLKFKSILAR